MKLASWCHLYRFSTTNSVGLFCMKFGIIFARNWNPDALVPPWKSEHLVKRREGIGCQEKLMNATSVSVQTKWDSTRREGAVRGIAAVPLRGIPSCHHRYSVVFHSSSCSLDSRTSGRSTSQTRRRLFGWQLDDTSMVVARSSSSSKGHY